MASMKILELRLDSELKNATPHVWYKMSVPRFNIKMSSYQYRKSHCGDKTILQLSYLHNGISYTGKMTSLYWIRAQVSIVNISDMIDHDIMAHNFAQNQP